MANVPSMFELAIPAAAGLLYALIWYSTRTLPRAGRIVGRVASLLILVPAVLYLSFGMPMQRDRVSQSPPMESRDEATRAPEPDMRRRAPEPQTSAPPPAPAPGPRGGDTAEVQPPPPPVTTQPSRAPRPSAPPSESGKPEDPAGGGGPPPGVPAAEKTDWDVVPVFYGTDRVRKDDPKRIAYTSDRARRLELGRALVTVPKVHQVPNIERPFALPVPYFKVIIYEQAEDPKQHFTIKELKVLPRDEFLALVRERLGGGRGFKDQALVFVHGYNTAFDHALYRAAQIAYDLQFDGAVFLYSWPSGGGVARLHPRSRKRHPGRALPQGVPRPGPEGERGQERQRDRPQHGQPAAAQCAARPGAVPAAGRPPQRDHPGRARRRPRRVRQPGRQHQAATAAASPSTAPPTTGP